MNSAYHRHVPHRSELGSSTSGQLHQFSSAVLVPVGSCEQHGPHLPLDTDTRIAAAVSSALAQRHPDTSWRPGGLRRQWRARVLSRHGLDRAGCPARCAGGVRPLGLPLGAARALVNGHGGNVGALRSATRLLRYEGRDVAWSSCSVPGGDAHAGHTETSVLLYLSPSDVLMDRTRPGNSAPLAELMPRMRHGEWRR